MVSKFHDEFTRVVSVNLSVVDIYFSVTLKLDRSTAGCRLSEYLPRVALLVFTVTTTTRT